MSGSMCPLALSATIRSGMLPRWKRQCSVGLSTVDHHMPELVSQYVGAAKPDILKLLTNQVSYGQQQVLNTSTNSALGRVAVCLGQTPETPNFKKISKN
eukprot:653959-Amphidinium_carterae.1